MGLLLKDHFTITCVLVAPHAIYEGIPSHRAAK